MDTERYREGLLRAYGNLQQMHAISSNEALYAIEV